MTIQDIINAFKSGANPAADVGGPTGKYFILVHQNLMKKRLTMKCVCGMLNSLVIGMITGLK